MGKLLRQSSTRCTEALTFGARGARAWLAWALLSLLAATWAGPARAGAIELALLQIQRAEQGVLLNFETRFDLPPGVSEALQKGVALHFSASVELVRQRWYWRDKRVAQASRTWRIAYQPLTFSYRVSLGGLSQTYHSLGEALRAVQSSSQWRIADPVPADDDGAYYAQFSYRLDTEQLPRPLQIGIGSQPEWNLHVERVIGVPPDNR
jgi:hypothetical protein